MLSGGRRRQEQSVGANQLLDRPGLLPLDRPGLDFIANTPKNQRCTALGIVVGPFFDYMFIANDKAVLVTNAFQNEINVEA